jgi:hypothetical protein
MNYQATAEAVRDYSGEIMFCCCACGVALTTDDFFEQGMRLPDNGESREEYCDAELLEGTTHIDCSRAIAGA